MTDNGVLSPTTEIDIPNWAPNTRELTGLTPLTCELPGLVAERVLSLAKEILNLSSQRRPSLAEEV